MAATNNDVTLSTTWTELTATYTGLVNTSAFVQNKGPGDAIVFWGGASAPALTNGLVLRPGDVSYGTAAKIWVRSVSAGFQEQKLASGTTD